MNINESQSGLVLLGMDVITVRILESSFKDLTRDLPLATGIEA